jgi:hypothetical protein
MTLAPGASLSLGVREGGGGVTKIHQHLPALLLRHTARFRPLILIPSQKARTLGRVTQLGPTLDRCEADLHDLRVRLRPEARSREVRRHGLAECVGAGGHGSDVEPRGATVT